MNYEPVIGLEVHVELNTKSKMFCRCSADYFGKKPNTHTCPVCLGLPGALPYINKEAIQKCIEIGLALDCEISKKSLFERKNYFYPDLPKGFQISQYRWPLCVNGHLSLADGQKIRINRVHQEEDTGKLTHAGSETMIDFNRSGVPLVEIVTEPDFTQVSQIKDYAQKLQQIFRHLGVSNADMEKGDMRLEANISIREVKSKKEKGKNDELPDYRVELKNINSFRFMAAAVEYEIKRQIEALEKGEKLIQETRGWDEDKSCTYSQRSKEEANDYRYFPEPDLPELRVHEVFDINKLKDEVRSKLPETKVNDWVEKYGITPTSGETILRQGTADLFEKTLKVAVKENIDVKDVANYIINKKIDSVSPGQVIEDIKSKKSGVIGDIGELEKLAKEAIDENPELVTTYKGGKVTVIMALVGAVMKKTSGKANAQKAREILEQLLEE